MMSATSELSRREALLLQFRTVNGLLLGLSYLSLLISGTLFIFATPLHRASHFVVVLICVTYVAGMTGLLAAGLRLSRTFQPRWTRVFPTLTLLCVFLYVMYFPLMEAIGPRGIQQLEPVFSVLMIVTGVCALLSGLFSAIARHRWFVSRTKVING